MILTLQPVRVATGMDEEGMLVFDGEQRLVAVLLTSPKNMAEWPVTGFWKQASAGRMEHNLSRLHRSGRGSGLDQATPWPI